MDCSGKRSEERTNAKIGEARMGRSNAKGGEKEGVQKRTVQTERCGMEKYPRVPGFPSTTVDIGRLFYEPGGLPKRRTQLQTEAIDRGRKEGDGNVCRKRDTGAHTTRSRSEPSVSVRGREEGRRNTPNYRFPSCKSATSTSSLFQNDHHQGPHRDNWKERLDVFSGPERRLQSHQTERRHEATRRSMENKPKNNGEGKLEVGRLRFRPKLEPVDFYHSGEDGIEETEEARIKGGGLHRRFVGVGKIKEGSRRMDGQIAIRAGEIGLHRQLQEVRTDRNTEVEVPRVRMGCSRRSGFSGRTKGKEDQADDDQTIAQRKSSDKRFGRLAWNGTTFGTGSKDDKGEDEKRSRDAQNYVKRCRMEREGPIVGTVQRRTQVVEKTSWRDQRQKVQVGSAHSSNRNGCFRHRMGSDKHNERRSHVGTLEKSPERLENREERIGGGHLWIKGMEQEDEEGRDDFDQSGFNSGTELFEGFEGRKGVRTQPQTHKNGEATGEEGGQSDCGVGAHSREHGRLSQSPETRHNGLDSEAGSLRDSSSSTQQLVSQTHSRRLRNGSQSPGGQVCELEDGPVCMENKFLSLDADGCAWPDDLDQPPVVFNAESSSSSQTVGTDGRLQVHSVLPLLADKQVVAGVGTNQSESDDQSSQVRGSLSRLLRDLTDGAQVGNSVCSIREEYWTSVGQSKAAIAAGNQQIVYDTRKNYGYAVRDWLLCCGEEVQCGNYNVEWCNVTWHNLTNYMALGAIYRMMAQKHACNVVNAINGLKYLLPPVMMSGWYDESVAKLVRKAQRTQQSGARYDTFPNMHEFLQSLMDTDIDWSDVNDVRQRLAVVLRLTLVARTKDIVDILERPEWDRCNRRLMWIKTKRKMEKDWHWEPITAAEEEYPHMCPIKLWYRYLQLSGEFRGSGSVIKEGRVIQYDTKERLFVRHNFLLAQDKFRGKTKQGPDGSVEEVYTEGWAPLGSQRLAKIVLECMRDHNINTEIYKAGCLRGAMGTYLVQQGMSVKAVMGRAHWYCEATFMKHYCRAYQNMDWTEAMLLNVGADIRQDVHKKLEECQLAKWSGPSTRQPEAPGEQNHSAMLTCKRKGAVCVVYDDGGRQDINTNKHIHTSKHSMNTHPPTQAEVRRMKWTLPPALSSTKRKKRDPPVMDDELRVTKQIRTEQYKKKEKVENSQKEWKWHEQGGSIPDFNVGKKKPEVEAKWKYKRKPPEASDYVVQSVEQAEQKDSSSEESRDAFDFQNSEDEELDKLKDRLVREKYNGKSIRAQRKEESKVTIQVPSLLEIEDESGEEKERILDQCRRMREDSKSTRRVIKSFRKSKNKQQPKKFRQEEFTLDSKIKDEDGSVVGTPTPDED